MATTNVVLPPAGKISLISIWIEALLYGISCVLYGLCMFVLFREKGTISSRWILVLTSTVLFLLATVHVASTLEQLLEAYVYAPPAILGYADIYFLEATLMRNLQDAVFVPLMVVQDLVLIWRLYVVFSCDWRVIVIPVLLEATVLATGIAAAVLVPLHVNVVHPIALASCSLNLAINILVTVAIAVRLWWMGQIVSSLSVGPLKSNPYQSSIWLIVESGAILAGVIAVSLAFYITGIEDDSFSLAWINITVQFAVITPLLIVVRVGLGLTHSLQEAYQGVIMSRAPVTVHSEIRFQAGGAEHTVEVHDRPSDPSRPTTYLDKARV